MTLMVGSSGGPQSLCMRAPVFVFSQWGSCHSDHLAEWTSGDRQLLNRCTIYKCMFIFVTVNNKGVCVCVCVCVHVCVCNLLYFFVILITVRSVY